MPITDYQAKYLAYELTKRCPSDSAEKLAGAVAGAQVGQTISRIHQDCGNGKRRFNSHYAVNFSLN